MARPRNRTQQPPQSADSPEDDGGAVLTVRQRLAIEHIVSGKTDIETADIIGVTGPTISRWRNNNPTWAAAEIQAEDEAVARTRRRLRSLTARAVDAIAAVMDGKRTDEDGNEHFNADPQHRLAAAKTVLDRAGVGEVKGVELTGANGGPIRTTLVDELNTASDDALRALVTAAAVVAEPKP
jgi:hypothetical protein